MAAAYCATIATTSFHFPPARKSPLLISAMCTPFPSKGNNYLHPDILKTQAKPFPDPILPEIPPAKPLIPLESTLEQQRQPQVKESDPIEQQPPDIPSDQLAGEETKEFDPVGQQPKLSSNQFSSEEMKEYVPIKRKSGFDFERFLSQKVQQSQVREFSFSETRRSAELENGVAEVLVLMVPGSWRKIYVEGRRRSQLISESHGAGISLKVYAGEMGCLPKILNMFNCEPKAGSWPISKSNLALCSVKLAFDLL